MSNKRRRGRTRAGKHQGFEDMENINGSWNRRVPKATIRPTGPPFCAIIKTVFMRDFMINLDTMLSTMRHDEYPSEQMEDLFNSLRIEGYEISRDGDTLCIRDISQDERGTPSPEQAELEADIVLAADVGEFLDNLHDQPQQSRIKMD